MKAAIKRQWIRALLSGRYDQGNSALHRNEENKWCCLGVLCNLRSVPGEWVNDEGRFSRYRYGRISQTGVLPGRVLRYVGMKPEQQDTLVTMNDTGKSFKEIAKWIKENL